MSYQPPPPTYGQPPAQQQGYQGQGQQGYQQQGYQQQQQQQRPYANGKCKQDVHIYSGYATEYFCKKHLQLVKLTNSYILGSRQSIQMVLANFLLMNFKEL